MSSRLHRVRAVSVVAALCAGLAGCGIGDRVAGTRVIPVEPTGGAPLDERTAVAIVARVLGQVASAPTGSSAAARTARAGVMTGAALARADAAARVRDTVPGPDPVLVPEEPQVLAISSGRAWPRSILATTLDRTSSTRHLHLLVSSAASRPFVLAASVPMAAGTSVPALGPLRQGAAPVGSLTKGDPKATEVLTAYTKALAHPERAKTALVTTKDPLARDLTANAAAQTKALGDLASLTQSHALVAGPAGRPIGFALAGGGAVVFGQLLRTDTVTLRPTAKEVLLPADIARLAKRTKVTRKVTVRTLEDVVIVIPESGPATVIGADEQRVDATGS
jgi:hypothetical protein